MPGEFVQRMLFMKFADRDFPGSRWHSAWQSLQGKTAIEEGFFGSLSRHLKGTGEAYGTRHIQRGHVLCTSGLHFKCTKAALVVVAALVSSDRAQ